MDPPNIRVENTLRVSSTPELRTSSRPPMAPSSATSQRTTYTMATPAPPPAPPPPSTKRRGYIDNIPFPLPIFSRRVQCNKISSKVQPRTSTHLGNRVILAVPYPVALSSHDSEQRAEVWIRLWSHHHQQHQQQHQHQHQASCCRHGERRRIRRLSLHCRSSRTRRQPPTMRNGAVVSRSGMNRRFTRGIIAARG